jgi:hypothetical protein
VGGVVGNYIDGEDFEWEGLAAAEWVEVTDLFDESIFNSMQDFLNNVPATDMYAYNDMASQIGGGFTNPGGALMSAAMDMSFLTNAAGANIWTAIINGQYDGGRAGGPWAISWVEGENHIDLTGGLWDNGQWQATVDGVWDSRAIAEGAIAAGSYDPNIEGPGGTFTGIGVGGWDEVE